MIRVCPIFQNTQTRHQAPIANRPGPNVSDPSIKFLERQGIDVGGDGKVNLEVGHEISISKLDTATLYRQLRSHNIKPDRIGSIVQALIEERLEKPNVELYSGLFRAYASSSSGSAPAIRFLIADADANFIELDEWACECIMEALSVHPDYMLYVELTQYMRENWFNFSNRGRHFEAASLIRDLQIEVAMEKMDMMVQEGIEVQDWLLELLYYSLAGLGDIDEAFSVCKQRTSSTLSRPSPVMWFHLLEHASRAVHYQATRFAWMTQVENSHVNPPIGVCRDVLLTASRHGDAQLCSAVLKNLRDRKVALDKNDYKLLIEAYTQSGDIGTAISVLSSMSEDRLKADNDTTSPFYSYMSLRPERLDSILDILLTLKSKGDTVPIAIIDCLINFAVSYQSMERVLELYHLSKELCATGPQLSTFDVLLSASSYQGKKELAMFVVSEMLKCGVKPDEGIYNRLILTCLADKDFEDAMKYFEEMKNMRMETSKLNRVTILKLAEGLAAVGDQRAWDILEDIPYSTERESRHMQERVKNRFAHYQLNVNEHPSL